MVVWMVGGRGLPHRARGAGGAGGGVLSRLSAKLWKGYVDDEMSWGGFITEAEATSEWVTFQFMAVTIP